MALLAERLAATFALMTALPLARPDTRLLAAWPGFFALVGLALGAALLVVDAGLREVMPGLPASATVVLVLAVLTGAMHLDGLADSADGLFGGRDPASRLRIMDDPHNGAFGFVAVALALILKFAAIASLDDTLRWGTLLLFPLAARASVLWLMATLPAARTTGMAHDAARPGLPLTVTLTIGPALVASLIFFPAGALLMVAAIAATASTGFYARRRIGGITGDVIGASIEVAEVAVLMLAATSAETGWLI